MSLVLPGNSPKWDEFFCVHLIVLPPLPTKFKKHSVFEKCFAVSKQTARSINVSLSYYFPTAPLKSSIVQNEQKFHRGQMG